MASANDVHCLSHNNKKATKTEKIKGITKYTLKHSDLHPVIY